VTPGPDGPLQISHVADAKWADLLAVAPASADIIAKIACGIADDQLTSTHTRVRQGTEDPVPRHERAYV